MKSYLIPILVGLSIVFGCKQDMQKSDSNAIAFNFLSSNLDSARYYANLTLSQSEAASEIYYAHYILGWVNQKHKNSLKAIENYKIALETIPDDPSENQMRSNLLLNIAIILKQHSQFELAIDYFKKAIEFTDSENKARILFNLGNCYKESNALEKATFAYEEALNLSGDNLSYKAKLFNAIGLVHYRLGNTDMAREYFFDLVISDGYKSKNKYMAHGYHNIANTYILDGNYVKAGEYFEKAMNIEGLGAQQRFVTLKDYGELKLELGDKSDGLRMLNAAEEIFGDVPVNEENISIYKLLGMAVEDPEKVKNYLLIYSNEVEGYLESRNEVLQNANYNFLQLYLKEFEARRKNKEINQDVSLLIKSLVVSGLVILMVIFLVYLIYQANKRTKSIVKNHVESIKIIRSGR